MKHYLKNSSNVCPLTWQLNTYIIEVQLKAKAWRTRARVHTHTCSADYTLDAATHNWMYVKLTLYFLVYQ